MISAPDIIVILNACVFIFVFFRYYRKHGVDIYSYLLFVWLASVVTGVIFYFINTFRDYSGITLLPLIVFNLLLFASFAPIARFRTSQIERIYLKNSGVLIIIGYFLVFVSIIPFLENSVILLSAFSGGDISSYVLEAYKMMNEGEMGKFMDDNMSKLGKKLNVLNSWMRDFSPILLFYFLSILPEKKHRILKAGLLLASLNPLLISFITGARVGIITQLMYFLFLFLLFRRFMSNSITKYIVRIGVFGGALFLLFLVLITVSRFDSLLGDVSMLEFVFWYSGEGVLNFANEMWYIKETMKGDNTMAYFKDVLGMNTFVNVSDRRNYWNAGKTGVTPYIFQTFIGDFWGDFRYWTIPILFVVVLVLFRLTRVKKEVPLYRILILSIWAKICLLGFTFYIYKTVESTRFLLTYLAMYCVLVIVHNFPSTKKRV